MARGVVSAVNVPGLMCDNADGCDQYDLDPTMGGLATVTPAHKSLPDGWTEPQPGAHLCWSCSTETPLPEVAPY